jgi:hypothetical protein
MSTVSLMTLIFLPGTAVAVRIPIPYYSTLLTSSKSMFGTQFFNADFSDSGVGKLHVSPDFYLFWALALSITLITLLVWYFWFRRSSERRYSGGRAKKEVVERGRDSVV